MQIDTDEREVIERVAALDVGKAEVVCCARVPGPGGQRMQEVRATSTMTAALLALGDWLAGLGVTRQNDRLRCRIVQSGGRSAHGAQHLRQRSGWPSF